MKPIHAKNLIAVNEFCISHNIELSFISSLHQSGLIGITTIEETEYIDAAKLLQLEKFVCFHYDLDINLEGIETITHLLQHILTLQHENMKLRNRLSLFEVGEE